VTRGSIADGKRSVFPLLESDDARILGQDTAKRLGAAALLMQIFVELNFPIEVDHSTASGVQPGERSLPV